MKSVAFLLVLGVALCAVVLWFGNTLIERTMRPLAAPLELLDEAAIDLPPETAEPEPAVSSVCFGDCQATPTFTFFHDASGCSVISVRRGAPGRLVVVNVDCLRQQYPDAVIEVSGHGATAQF